MSLVVQDRRSTSRFNADITVGNLVALQHDVEIDDPHVSFVVVPRGARLAPDCSNVLEVLTGFPKFPSLSFSHTRVAVGSIFDPVPLPQYVQYSCRMTIGEGTQPGVVPIRCAESIASSVRIGGNFFNQGGSCIDGSIEVLANPDATARLTQLPTPTPTPTPATETPTHTVP